MADNRKYSRISREQTLSDLTSILRSKEGNLADLGASSYGRTLIELFAAHSDMNAFGVEEGFNNALMIGNDAPSIYANVRTLGYSIRRPVPARAGFGISLKRTGSKPTVKVNISKNTVFTIGGKSLIAIDDVEFLYDRNEANFEDGIMTLVNGRAILIDAIIKNQQFFSNGNKFQEFNLVDNTFSDWFGSQDPNYVEPDSMSDRVSRFCVISSDSGLMDSYVSEVPGFEDKIFWKVSRRGLIDPYLDNSIMSEEDISGDNISKNFTALVETANDGSINISFGDGVLSAIPYGLINVKYLSTQGEDGNLINVAGSKLTADSQNVLITQVNGQESDLTLDDLNISLTTDIRGGLNIETIEAIKRNAPRIFSSLDSLGNRNSYSLFLMRQYGIKYANAFGEDYLSKISHNRFNIKYSNVVRYTLLKDLYRKTDNNYYVADPYQYYVSGYKVNGLAYAWDYDYSQLPDNSDVQKIELEIEQIRDNIIDSGLSIYDEYGNQVSADQFVANYVPKTNLLVPTSVFNAHINPEDFLVEGSEIFNINASLNVKGYLTLEGNHMYVPPIVHDLGMDIDVILFEGVMFSDVKSRIINTIYSYLKENTKFSYPIYRSKVESLVQEMPEVQGVNLLFKTRNNPYFGLKIDELLWLGPQTAQYITQDTSVLDIDRIDITFLFDYDTSGVGSTELYSPSQVDLTMTSQLENVRNLIKNYYVDKLSKKDPVSGKLVPKTNITEEDLNMFSGYIWSLTMNQIYTELNKQYKTAKLNAEFSQYNKLYGLIEAIKGWYFENGILKFKDTDAIKNLKELGISMTQYIYYALDYIKLVRNILSPIVAAKLIDEDGNVTKYSGKHEIVQFLVSSTDITLKVGKS